MAKLIDDIADRISRMTAPGFRGNLVARGLARGLLWRDGVLPPDAPAFSPDLTTDLLDHGFHLLAAALTLRDRSGGADAIRRGLHAAAESLESAARYDGVAVVERGFHLTMAAAAFHIGGFAARAYSLFEGDLAQLNLSSYETALVYLMRRDLGRLRGTFLGWLGDSRNSDDGVLARLQGRIAGRSGDDFGADDVVAMALTRHFHRSIATYEHALVTGAGRPYRTAIEGFRRGEDASAEAKHVPLWWSFRVARHLCDDLWRNSLRVLLPPSGGPPRWGELREQFITLLGDRDPAELDLWPSQVEAAGRVVDADDLVVALPTSAGKTRIAELCILRALADSKRVIYVTPLRALSAQIEHGLARTFRPMGVPVTSVYGASGVAHSDLETLKSATIVVATPEKLDFAIRQEPSVIDDVSLIVLDEGHMIGLGEREIRYETLVQRLLRRADAGGRRLVCLSAVFTEGEAFDDFTAWLRSDAPGGAVRSVWRPTRQRPGRLMWTGATGRLELDVDGERPFVPRFVDSRPATGRRKTAFPHDAQEYMVAAAASFLARGQSVLIYCPERRSVEPMAAAFLKAGEQGYFASPFVEFPSAEIADAVRIGAEWLGDTHPAVKCLALGIAVHHGALPRQFLGEVETLLRRRLLPLCVCSPTLAQGLDLSFGVLLFKSLYRSGELIPAKEFANVVGRVGRAFVDLDGLYVLPVFEADKAKAESKVKAFDRLNRQAQKRQLESGVRGLIGSIISVLTDRLACDPDELGKYVLNLNNTWKVEPREGDDPHAWLDAALNELDTAILGVVDALDLPTEGVADYLDGCLQSSYWQRRLKSQTPEVRDLQAKVIRGRATWLWKSTRPESRRAYFAAGVGYKAGVAIEASLDDLHGLLSAAESALVAGDTAEAASRAGRAAAILYGIGPFAPEGQVKDLPGLLYHWLSGSPLSEYPDREAASLVQDSVVYRLVWAVEAARLHFQHLRGDGDETAPGGLVALCLTYGVPSATAALLMQGGMRSRAVATAAAGMIGEAISDFGQLKSWMRKLGKGLVPDLNWGSPDWAAEWKRFRRRFEQRHRRVAAVTPLVLRAEWADVSPPKAGTRVRVTGKRSEADALVLSVSALLLGTTELPAGVQGVHFTGRVRSDRMSVLILARVNGRRGGR